MKSFLQLLLGFVVGAVGYYLVDGAFNWDVRAKLKQQQKIEEEKAASFRQGLEARSKNIDELMYIAATLVKEVKELNKCKKK